MVHSTLLTSLLGLLLFVDELRSIFAEAEEAMSRLTKGTDAVRDRVSKTE
jgi:hypothetical protein